MPSAPEDNDDGSGPPLHLTRVLPVEDTVTRTTLGHLSYDHSEQRKTGGLFYWPKDDKKTPIEGLKYDDSVLLEVRLPDRLISYDGNNAHETQAFDGTDRISLIFFTIKGIEKLPTKDYNTLTKLGFQLPESVDELSGFCEEFRHRDETDKIIMLPNQCSEDAYIATEATECQMFSPGGSFADKSTDNAKEAKNRPPICLCNPLQTARLTL